jgi:hypothetical protein
VIVIGHGRDPCVRNVGVLIVGSVPMIPNFYLV